MKITLSGPAVTISLVVAHAYLGLGYLLGPPRISSSGSLSVAMAWTSAHTWGALITAGALLTLLAPHLNVWSSAVLHALAAAPGAALALAILLADLSAQSTGWGGVLLFGAPVLFHALLVRARILLAARGAAS